MNEIDAPGTGPPRIEATRTEPGSYRDPASRVFHVGGEVYRALDERGWRDWERLAATRFFADAVARGSIVATNPAPDIAAPVAGQWAGVLHHERVPIVSYPYEWTFGMLRRAALLQLDLLAAALAEDMILKDATPYNVQWIGTRPVFIDIGSFERLEPGEVWVGYRQFLRQYLYPLMLTAHVGIPFQGWLRGQPEGLTSEEIRRLLPARHKLGRSGLLHVALQARAERRYEGGERNVRSELKAAGFRKELIQANVRGLRRIVDGLSWEPERSEWNRYAAECGHVAAQRDAKTAFVSSVLTEHRPDVVWDVGANDGHFSKLAAAHAGYVLALDADALVLDQLFEELTSSNISNLLPLLQDLADPSPGIGWRGAERPPLAGRSEPDLVLCLAVVHHLVVGRNIPLRSVVDWLADLRARVVLEFVPPDDPMVRRLTANKRPHEVHRDYTETDLRSYLDGRLHIEHEADVPGSGRKLLSLRPVD